MPDLTGIQHTILETLSVQLDGYLTNPSASAFIAVGLIDGEEVYEELIGLQDEGLVEFYKEEEHRTLIKVEKDENGEPILNEDGTFNPVLDEEDKVMTENVVAIVNEGWVITGEGREALK